jgi:hypothetical protein
MPSADVRVGETRVCGQCGTVFEPQREHARFCSARCRVVWNHEHTSRDDALGSALGWSFTAMAETTSQLATLRALDPPQVFAVISEAVWWVTIVDATLVRYHPAAYRQVLAAQPPGRRQLTEGTFAGLRFVRNRMGYHTTPAEFIQPTTGSGPVTAWIWRPLPPPAPAGLPLRTADWEMSRYHAYTARLTGHPLGQTFSRAAAFLTQATTTAREE